MRFAFSALAGAALSLSVSACGGSLGFESDEPVVMSLTFELMDRHLCSGLSPQLDVRNTPKEVTRYRIELTELSSDQMATAPGTRVGGDVISFEGERVPEGRLNAQRWQGPCPPLEGGTRYRITVDALDAEGEVIGRAAAERDL